MSRPRRKDNEVVSVLGQVGFPGAGPPNHRKTLSLAWPEILFGEAANLAAVVALPRDEPGGSGVWSS